MIAEDPAEVFDAQKLYQRLPATPPLAKWEQQGGEAVDGGVRLAAGEQRLVLSRALHRAADELTLLRVTVEQDDRVSLALQWAGAGEEFGDERRMVIEGKPPRHKNERGYSFRLTDHPRWHGEIERLRLQLETGTGAGLKVRSLRGFSEQLASDRLAAALARAWKVDLGNDVRSAVVTVPAAAAVRTVTVPAGGRLRFACGLPGARGAPVTFRVKAGEGGEVVYEHTIDPRTSVAAAAWHDADVDLGRFAGREIPLVFETSVSSSAEGLETFPAWANPELYGAADGAPATNVVLISVDTLRADRTSLYGNPRPTTPYLERWAARRAAVFEQAVAQAPWTLPSHTSMLTGLNAFRHGVNHKSPAPASLELLAERLRAAGYSTLAITGGGLVHPGYGLGQGFDRFRYWGRDLSAIFQTTEKELSEHVPLAAAWLEEHADRPFFLFFHTYETHHPYRARQPYFDKWSSFSPVNTVFTYPEPTAADGFKRSCQLMLEEPGADGPQQRPLPPELAQLPYDFYDSGVAYADALIGRLLDRIVKLGLAERTLVILTSDHGELFGEHGVNSHLYLYEENLMVPLVVAHPAGDGAGRRISQQVRSVDIVPTVLDVLGLPPAAGLDGASLVPLLAGDAGGADFPEEAWSYAASSNYGVSLRLANRLKYHHFNSVWPPINGRERLFDLRRDPGEQRDLRSETAQLDTLRRRLHATVPPAVSGPRLALANAGSTSFTVRLAGSGVRTANVKSFDLACPCLEWDGAATVRAEVPPDTAYTLLFEDVRPDDELRLLDGEGREIAAYSLAAIAEPQRLALTGGRWRAAAADEEAAHQIQVWWHGARQLGAAAPEDNDPALRIQLKALGYL